MMPKIASRASLRAAAPIPLAHSGPHPIPDFESNPGATPPDFGKNHLSKTSAGNLQGM